jgi:Tol biopolymer transport system component
VEALLLAAVLALHPAQVASDTWPVWSPDGRSIAFVRFEGRSSAAFVVRRDGSGLRRVSKPDVWMQPVWSPDESTLAVVRTLPDERAAIDLVTLRTGRERRLAMGAQPAWSPDGRRIVFLRDSGLAIVDVRSRRVRPLSIWTEPGRPVSPGSPAWSPDGSRLALTSGGNRIAVVSARGGRGFVLALGSGPAWSPDGTTIAAGCLWGELVAFYDPAAPGSGCAIGILEAFTATPRWSPSGDRVAASGCFFDDCTVWIQARGTNTKTVLGQGATPSWAPGGRTIAFTQADTPGGPWHLYLIGADGTGLRPLLP